MPTPAAMLAVVMVLVVDVERPQIPVSPVPPAMVGGEQRKARPGHGRTRQEPNMLIGRELSDLWAGGWTRAENKGRILRIQSGEYACLCGD